MAWPSKGFEKNVEDAASMYSEGRSLEEIASHFGVLRGTITYHFKKNNIAIRDISSAHRHRAKWIGRKYDLLTVIDWESNPGKKDTVLTLQCTCGALVQRLSSAFSRPRKEKWSCPSCLENIKLQRNWGHLIGKKSGSRTIVDFKYEYSEASSTPWKTARVLLRCECGSEEWSTAVSVKRRLFEKRKPYENYCKNCRPKPKPRINHHGYRMIYSPNQDLKHVTARGMILEHLHVMCEHLGHELYINENVHHINGDKLDNRIENLELWETSQPKGQRVRDKIEHYREFLERYGFEVKKR